VAVPSGFLPVEIPDFFEQIDEYIADGVNPDALHYLDFGGNDALALLFGMPPDEIITRSEEAIMIGGQALIDAGAQNFVIRTIDNFGAKRGVNGGNASVFDDLAPFYSAYNTAILDAYSTLARSNPGTTFYVFDLGPVLKISF
jgi:phospholipase/lecithinase/hemolysin